MAVKKTLLFIEYLLFYFGAPLLIIFTRDFILPSVILIPVLFIILILLRTNKSFTWHEIIRWQISRYSIKFNIIVILLTCLLLFLYVYLFTPEHLLNFPNNNSNMWIALCILYPIFSAYPQEIVYRTFLIRRYKRLFGRPVYFILASGISFGFAHILYFNVTAIVLSFLLGVYLSSMYIRTKSVLFTSIIHSVLGNFVFTIGLGHHFLLEIDKFFLPTG